MFKNQYGLASIIIVLIVLALIAGGILVWQYFGAPKEEVKVPEEMIEDETADWKIYTNFEYSYEIKYPSLWESPVEGWAPGWTAGKLLDDNNYCIIDILSYPASTGPETEEIADLLKKGYIQTSAKIGGIDGVRLTDSSSKAGLTEAVYFSYKSDNFRIGRNRGFGTKIEEECINTFNQMLSTFLFLENKCKPVELKDVINYYDSSKVVYIKTSGTIVGLKYDDYGGSILLSDNSHYLLVAISHVGMGGDMKEILAGLRQGDKIEVEGIPSFTSPKVADLKNRLNLQQELPEIIGMLELAPCMGEGIKKK